MSRNCSCPGCKSVGLHLCSGCGEEIYCSKECQKKHWPLHKRTCTVALKPEAAAFMQSFDGLSEKQLKNLILAKSACMEGKKKEILLSQIEKATDKNKLLFLVKNNVQTSEIEALLTNNSVTDYQPSIPVPETKIKNGKKQIIKTKPMGGKSFGGNAAAAGGDNMSPEQMKQQANMMRKNPDLVRKSHPMFAKMTNTQIIEYANHLEKIAADPSMLKEAQKFSKFSNKERESLQLIQEGLSGTKPMDDKWIENAIATLKAHPDLFKTLFQGRGAAGVSDDQIGGFIDYVSKMDATLLKYIFKALRYLAGFAEPLQNVYNFLDKWTWGLAKHMLFGIAVFILSIAVMYLWRGLFWVGGKVFSPLVGRFFKSSATSTVTNLAATAAAGGASVASVVSSTSAGEQVSAAAAAAASGVAASAGAAAGGAGAGADAEFDF